MRLSVLAIGLLLSLGVTGVDAQQRAIGNKDLVLTLRNAGNFSVFLQVIEGAGWTQQLRGTSQFTVFAPTDDPPTADRCRSRDGFISKSSTYLFPYSSSSAGAASSVRLYRSTHPGFASTTNRLASGLVCHEGG